jgi:hypothetical protein
MWERCPQQWYINRVKKIRQRSSDALVLGSVYHSTLEENFKQKLILGHDLDFDICYDVFCTAWDKCIHDEGDIRWNGKNPDAVKDLGIKLIDKYMTDIAPTIMPVEVEKTYSYMAIDGVPFTLRLDMLLADGAVIDHKTSSRIYTQEDVDKGDQATATAFVLGRPIVFYNHVAVKTKVPHIQIVKTIRTSEDIKWWYKKAEAIIKHMKTGYAPPNQDSWLCSSAYCDYWDVCRGGLTRLS